jgi:HK97 family phage prohead protease
MTEQRDRFHNLIKRTLARVDAAHPDLNYSVRDLYAEWQTPWFEVRSAASSDGEATSDTPDVAQVYILDEIGGSLGVQASKLVREIDAITEPIIHVRINSPGGSVFDAVTIHSALLHHPAKVRSYVDGLAASAATVIAMAADPLDEADDTGGVVVMPGGQMMIHDASMMIEGNQADLDHGATFLGRQSDNVARLYQRRAGGTAEEWRALMLAETWMFDEEAVAMGLADRVEVPPRAPEPRLDEALARTHDLSRFAYRGRRNPPRRAASGGGAPPDPPARTADRTPPDDSGRRTGGQVIQALTDPTTRKARAIEAGELIPSDPKSAYRAAAQQRGEGAERRAHALAQGDSRLPVLNTSPRYQSQLRVVRAELPAEAGRARLQSFPGRLARSGTVKRNGRELIHLNGYATVFNVLYDMWDSFGPYKENTASGSADRTLASSPDVAFLTNHLGVTMARTKAGTLDLAADETGLSDDPYLNPDRADVQLLMHAIDDGSIDEQSFAFMIDEGWWNDSFEVFTIERFDIDRGDVSAVNFGANPYTSIHARGQQLIADLDRLPLTLARAAVDRLTRRTDLSELRAAWTRQEVAAPPAPCPECGADNPAGATSCGRCQADMATPGELEPAAATPHRSASKVMGRTISQVEAMIGRLDD